MTKKLFLTSAMAMCIIAPAMAVPSHTSATFPNDDYMLEDYTYTGQATYSNMGVYEGNVTADPDYEWVLLSPTAGQYLPQSSTSVAQCTAGSYCPGATDIHYDDTQDQGIYACPGTYSNSEVGSSANTDCYRTCATTDVLHSATVSGAMYYNGTNGDGVNACAAATCVNGYHVKAGVPDLNNLIGTDTAGEASPDPATMTFSVNFGDRGIISGQGRCSTISGTSNNSTWSNPTILNDLTDETGQEGALYCYCTLDGYTPNNGTLQSFSSPWMFVSATNNANNCTTDCVTYCSSNLRRDNAYNLAFRSAMFNSLGSHYASCEANTINITWNGASAEDIAANDAGQCTYDGDIRTPRAATPITGKTFKGWKFIKTNN